MKRISTLSLVILFATGFLYAEDSYDLNVKTEKPAISYSAGETVTFVFHALLNGQPLSGHCIRWERFGDDCQTSSGITKPGAPMMVKASLDKPGFVCVKATLSDAEGKAVTIEKNGKDVEVTFSAGAGFDIDKLDAPKEPENFDSFWKEQLVELDSVPVRILEKKAVPYNEKSKCFDIKIACPGGMPVSGYLIMPADAKAKSLPVVIDYMGYGVSGAYNPRFPITDKIILFTNAHGILNGQPKAYYKNLSATTLKGYGFSGNADPRSSYFRNMLLRGVRAVEFMRTLPEWDGENIKVQGGSQGGFQALAVAALSPYPNHCNAWIPWLCDVSGEAVGNRHKSWFRPAYESGLDYYDSVNFAKRIKCPVSITAGLADYVCPPSGVAILYKNISVAKKIKWVQGKKHGSSPKNAETFAMESD